MSLPASSFTVKSARQGPTPPSTTGTSGELLAPNDAHRAKKMIANRNRTDRTFEIRMVARSSETYAARGMVAILLGGTRVPLRTTPNMTCQGRNLTSGRRAIILHFAKSWTSRVRRYATSRCRQSRGSSTRRRASRGRGEECLRALRLREAEREKQGGHRRRDDPRHQHETEDAIA